MSRVASTVRTFGLAALAGCAVLAWQSPAAASTAGRFRNAVQLGDCLYRTHRAIALRLVNAVTPRDSDRAFTRLQQEHTCFTGLVVGPTLDGEMANFSKDLIRGTIAEAALKTSSEAAALPALAAPDPLARSWFATTAREPSVDAMSVCVADTDPRGILVLLGSVPNSTEESYAIGNLQPSLARCLIAGQRLNADRTALRAALADALYQRVHNPIVADASSSSETSK